MGIINCLHLLNLTNLSFSKPSKASGDRSTMILSQKYISLEKCMLFFPPVEGMMLKFLV